MTVHDNQIVLECTSISKSYGNVKALANVSMTLRSGEVRALLGKNGAGKSTLVNLISGSQVPDRGSLHVDGIERSWSGPAEAKAGGVSVVHQEFSLVPGLTVAENIMLGVWPSRGWGNQVIDAAALRDVASRALDRLGIPIPLWARVGSLRLAQQQIVEIAKALVGEPRVLILDEPTSALNSTEVDALIALVRRLAGQGMAIIYVSHRMQEIPRVADSLTVLRDGEEIETLDVADSTPELVARLIAGDDGSQAAAIARRDRRTHPVVLSVQNMRLTDVLDGVGFELHEGEVLGIAGLLGSGRTELVESIFGVRGDVSGEVRVAGELVVRRTPSLMLNRGVGFTSENRKSSGIVPQLGVGENLVLSARGRTLPRLIIDAVKESSLAQRYIKRLSIASFSAAQRIDSLSGGNQQKAVIGRLLAADMKVLLLDEPTRGIDVHAKTQIYELVRELADQGVSSIFISSELEELSEVCDRVIVLRNGHVTNDLMGIDASSEKLLALTMKDE